MSEDPRYESRRWVTREEAEAEGLSFDLLPLRPEDAELLEKNLRVFQVLSEEVLHISRPYGVTEIQWFYDHVVEEDPENFTKIQLLGVVLGEQVRVRVGCDWFSSCDPEGHWEMAVGWKKDLDAVSGDGYGQLVAHPISAMRKRIDAEITLDVAAFIDILVSVLSEDFSPAPEYKN